LEAGAWASYAMAHTESNMFAEVDGDGHMEVPKRLEKARNEWLRKNYETKSNEIENLKRIINASVAHANLIHASNAFQMRDSSNPGFDSPFFDLENPYQVRSDLWFVGNTAMGLTDLLVEINKSEKVFQLIDDFDERFLALSSESSRQRRDMMQTPEYKRAEASRQK
jgi:hypothetical protein